MNVSEFANELLGSLATIPQVERVDLRSEGPTVSGRAYITSGHFLAFYFNQITQTQAFALVNAETRLWGIDYDKLRGWHLHPLHAPDEHQAIEPQSISAIILELGQVLHRIQA